MEPAAAPPPKPPWRRRAIDEALEIGVLTAYLFITIGAVNVMKAAVLHDHGVHVAYWGVAIVKAALLAKFVLLGKALKVGEHNKTSPLIWPTLHKAFAFLVLLFVLTVLEEIVMGWFHHLTVAESMAELFGMRLPETLAGVLVLLLVLIPYFAFEMLAETLGEGRLVRMFLTDRNAFHETRPGGPPA